MEQRETFTERACVAYATVGRGKRVHYSPRNDDTLCGRMISAYEDAESVVALFNKGYELCAPCHRAAEKRAAQRAEAARLAAASPLAAAAVTLAETVEHADAERATAERTDPERDVEARYVVHQLGDDYGVMDAHTVEWVIEQTARDDAKATAARLNREYAEARAAGPIVHRFNSTREAYDATQCRDHILDGDVLVIEREQVVGFLRGAWPGAITAMHGGELHTVTGDPRTIDDGKYAGSVDLAEQLARELGAPLAAEQRVVEGVVVGHAGHAEGSTPSNATHPAVVAAREALAGLAAASLTDHHDFSAPSDDERNVRGYVIDPRGQGRVALYWLEDGRNIRRDEMPHGPALDCLADRMSRRGWAVEKMLRSSQCVFAHRPGEDVPQPEAQQAPTVEENTRAANEVLAAVDFDEPQCVHKVYPLDGVSGDPIKTCDTKRSIVTAGVWLEPLLPQVDRRGRQLTSTCHKINYHAGPRHRRDGCSAGGRFVPVRRARPSYGRVR